MVIIYTIALSSDTENSIVNGCNFGRLSHVYNNLLNNLYIFCSVQLNATVVNEMKAPEETGNVSWARLKVQASRKPKEESKCTFQLTVHI